MYIIYRRLMYLGYTLSLLGVFFGAYWVIESIIIGDKVLIMLIVCIYLLLFYLSYYIRKSIN